MPRGLARPILLLMLLGLWLFPGQAPAASPALVRLGILPVPDTLPLQVAVRDGLFAREGLAVELVPFASALERDVAMQTGNLDGYFGDMVATLLLLKAGAPLRVVTVAYESTPGQPMFGLVTSPQRPGLGLADLKGRSLGISESTIIEYVLDRMTQAQGLPAMERVDVKKLPVRLQMLEAGQLDAALLPEPFVALARKNGGVVVATDEGLGLPLTVVCLAQPVVDRPEALAAFRRAYAEALRRLADKPQAYAAFQAEACRIPKSVAAEFPVFRYPAMRLPTEAEVAAVGQWMVAKKLLPAPMAYQRVMAP